MFRRVFLAAGLLACMGGVSAETLWSVSSNGGTYLRTVDLATAATLTQVPITLSAETIHTVTGLALHPQTKEFYAILKLSGQSGRELVTIDRVTGAATSIGDTGDSFAGIAFNGDGSVLWAVTGENATMSESLFTIDQSTGAATFLCALGSGTDGETIGFNPVDGTLYHASGHLGAAEVIFETIDDTSVSPCAVTNINITGGALVNEETQALTWWNSQGVFLWKQNHGIGPLFSVTTAGAETLIGDMDHQAKGLIVTAPEFDAAPDPLDFGNQNIGTTSGAQSVTITNTGSEDLVVTDVSAASAPFADAGGTCGALPFTLAPLASCTLDYTFSPSATGAVSDTIQVTSNASTSPDSFGLAGTGTEPIVSISPDPLDFGSQAVGTTSGAQSVTLSNTGSGTLNVSSVSAPSTPFAAAGGSCGAAPFTIAPTASCTLDYTFSPTASGAASDSITVTSDALSSPDSFGLAGTGVQSTVSLTPGTVDFGDQTVGTSSDTQTVTLTNTGSGNLDVSSVSAPGAPFAAAGGTCGAAPFTLAPSASCTLTYTFSPTATGAASTTVSVSSNAASSPDSFTLQGNGVSGAPPPVPAPAVIPALGFVELLLFAALLGLIGALALAMHLRR